MNTINLLNADIAGTASVTGDLTINSLSSIGSTLTLNGTTGDLALGSPASSIVNVRGDTLNIGNNSSFIGMRGQAVGAYAKFTSSLSTPGNSSFKSFNSRVDSSGGASAPILQSGVARVQVSGMYCIYGSANLTNTNPGNRTQIVVNTTRGPIDRGLRTLTVTNTDNIITTGGIIYLSVGQEIWIDFFASSGNYFQIFLSVLLIPGFDDPS